MCAFLEKFNMPTYIVRASKRAKFLLCEDETRNEFFIVSHPDCGRHTDLLEMFASQIGRAKVLGGGYLRVNEEAGCVHVWDSSGSFGAEDRKITRKVLAKKYPKFSILTTLYGEESWCE
jgi:hypothetical protein